MCEGEAEGVYLPQLSFLHQNDSLPSISTSDVSPEGLASSSSPAMVNSYTNPTERWIPYNNDASPSCTNAGCRGAGAGGTRRRLKGGVFIRIWNHWRVVTRFLCR